MSEFITGIIITNDKRFRFYESINEENAKNGSAFIRFTDDDEVLKEQIEKFGISFPKGYSFTITDSEKSDHAGNLLFPYDYNMDFLKRPEVPLSMKSRMQLIAKKILSISENSDGLLIAFEDSGYLYEYTMCNFPQFPAQLTDRFLKDELAGVLFVVAR